MPKEKSEKSNEIRSSSLAALLEKRWRFPHKADVIDREFKRKPTGELRKERERLTIESTKIGEELAKVAVDLKELAASSEMQWWEQRARHVSWWDLERVAKVARDSRFSVLGKQRDILRKSRHMGMWQNKVSMQISLLSKLLAKI